MKMNFEDFYCLSKHIAFTYKVRYSEKEIATDAFKYYCATEDCVKENTINSCVLAILFALAKDGSEQSLHYISMISELLNFAKDEIEDYKNTIIEEER